MTEFYFRVVVFFPNPFFFSHCTSLLQKKQEADLQQKQNENSFTERKKMAASTTWCTAQPKMSDDHEKIAR